MLPLKGIIFLGLNVLRMLSVLALIFVFSGTLVLMVRDSNAYTALRRQGGLADAEDTCDYYPDSDVPTTPWGVFWTELDRFWILCLCILCAGSEFGISRLASFYSNFVPILGPTFSTLALGVVQVMIASSLLSHFLDGFPLVAPWILFFVGILNALAGLAFGARIKLRRSFMRSKRDMLVMVKSDIEKSIPFGGAMMSLAKTGIDAVGQAKARRRSGWSKARSTKSRCGGEKEQLLWPRDSYSGGVRPVPTAMDAFYSHANKNQNFSLPNRSVAGDGSPQGEDEVLRWRARQENMLAEKEQERMDVGRATPGLSQAYRWDSQHSLVVPRPTPSQERESLQTRIEHAQAGMCHDLTSPRRASMLSTVEAPTSLAYSTYPAPPRKKGGGFKRRTLVLSKMVQQVKRGSMSAASAATSRFAGPRPQMPRMPGHYQSVTTGLKPVAKPGPWIEVDVQPAQTAPLRIPPPPPASYRTGRAHVYDVEGSSTEHSLPVAERFLR